MTTQEIRINHLSELMQLQTIWRVQNTVYFDNALPPVAVKFGVQLPFEHDAEYHHATKSILLKRSYYQGRMWDIEVRRYAADSVLHEQAHQWMYLKGIPHTALCDHHEHPEFIKLLQYLTVRIGLPFKSYLTPAEIRSFPQSITSPYYYQGQAKRHPLYDWSK